MNKRDSDQGEAAPRERPGNPAVTDQTDAATGPNAHNIDPENMGEDANLVEDPPGETATPPGPTSK